MSAFAGNAESEDPNTRKYDDLAREFICNLVPSQRSMYLLYSYALAALALV